MTEVLPDIPRLVTGIAEWLGCLIYLLALSRRHGPIGTALLLIGGLGALVGLQLFAGELPIQFWTITMAASVVTMFWLIRLVSPVARLDAAYLTARAFVLAELVASLAWQLHLYYFRADPDYLKPLPLGLLVTLFAICYAVAWRLERRHFSIQEPPDIGPRSIAVSAAIAGITFALSNLSFLTTRTPFSGSVSADVFYIRTLVDLCGFVALYAQHEQLRKQRADAELLALDAVLRSQHEQYLQSKRDIEQVNTAYHDLKHQVGLIRAELDPQRRQEHLDELEQTVNNYGVRHHTGNPVVDTILTSKARFCVANGIEFTCVADGRVLDGVSTVDLASLLGNALENAIESVQRLDDADQRIIKVALSARNNFAVLRVENYFDGQLNYHRGRLVTRKNEAGRHGLGLRSIEHIAESYGGQATTQASDNWFTLTVLLPLPGR